MKKSKALARFGTLGLILVTLLPTQGARRWTGYNTVAALEADLNIAQEGVNPSESWIDDSSLQVKRYRHSIALWNDHIYVMGGMENEIDRFKHDTIERTAINPDGSLEPWQTIGTLPDPRWMHESIAIDGYVYVVGGTIDDQDVTEVIYAPIQADGSLGLWQTTSPLNEKRSRFALTSVDGYLYAIGGHNGSTYMNSVEYAQIQADGSLGPWQMTSSLITPRYGLDAVAVGGYIYALTGYNLSLGYISNTEYAAVQSDGTLGTWQVTSSLNIPRGLPAAVTNGDSIYVFGGTTGAGHDAVAQSEVVAVNSDHTLGAWQYTTSMDPDRGGAAAVWANGYAYVTGGATYGTFLTNVERLYVGGIGPGPSITSASLNISALPAYGDSAGDRRARLRVRVADPDGPSDIDSVTVDLSSIGGTLTSLQEDNCSIPEDGLYCGTVYTVGAVETGDKTLTITAIDKAGFVDVYDLEVKVVMLLSDVVDQLQNNRDAILGDEIWIAAMAAENFDPEAAEGILAIVHVIQLLLKADPMHVFLEMAFYNIFLGGLKAQLLLSTHPAEAGNILMTSWKPATGPDFLPLGVPYYLQVRVENSGHPIELDFDYVEILEVEEDRPSPTHPYYTIPTGYSYYDYRDIADTSEGTQACTIAVVTERYTMGTWTGSAYLRLQLTLDSQPFIVRVPSDERMPNLGTLALVCGTKRTESAPVYDIYSGGLVYDVLTTTEEDGSVMPLRILSSSLIEGHEFLGEPSMGFWLDCPADLHLYAADGSHVGPVYDTDGDVIGFENDIPNAAYVYGEGDTPEFALVPNPVSGYYTVTVHGTDGGAYTQTINIMNRGGFQTYTSTVAAQPTHAGKEDITVMDEIPAAPSGLKLDVGSGMINLDWDDNTESDLAGYNVYRSTQAIGVYQKMNDSLLLVSHSIDNPVSENTVYYYYLDFGHF